MITRTRLAAIALAFVIATPPAAGQDPDRVDAAAREQGPNIILIFVDDLGYGDLSVTGNTDVRTVNIDGLARQGTRFTQFYVNAPICSPSRVAITTGTFPARWRINSFLHAREANHNRGMADWLDRRAPTLPRALREAGYAVGHFGKWHMGGGRDIGDAPLPQEYGFHESLTQFEGLGERYLWHDELNEQSAALGRGKIHWTEKHRMSEHYVDYAIDFMRRHRDQPFYLNLWPDDVHDEWRPRPELVAKYEGVARNEDEQKFFAVLDELDRQLGRLIGEVTELGLEERTLIIFTSDNGPTDAPWYYEDSDRAPGSTAGFRGRKLSLYEGGIRMPLIVRWPGHTPGGVVDERSVLSSVDLAVSLARLAGASFPTGVTLDGEDLSGALLGEPDQRQQPLLWFFMNRPAPSQPEHFSPNYAIRDGRWKLLVNPDGSRPELYDLEADPGETTDLASERPELVARLTERVMDWRSRLPSETEAAVVPKQGDAGG